MECYVYAFGYKGCHIIKIGISNNPDQRAAALRQVIGHTGHMIKTFGPFTRREALQHEKRLHYRFKGWRRFGEWFDAKHVTVADVEQYFTDLQRGTLRIDEVEKTNWLDAVKQLDGAADELYCAAFEDGNNTRKKLDLSRRLRAAADFCQSMHDGETVYDFIAHIKNLV